MKFKLGDRVKVKTNSRIGGGRYAGLEGKVVSVVMSVYPYRVRFTDGGGKAFHANELEKV